MTQEPGDLVRINKELHAMPEFVRKAFPYVKIVGGLIALAWAISFGTLPKADFSFANGDEVRTVDPAKASGQPEHRILNALFEGLLRQMPADVAPDEDGEEFPVFPEVAEVLAKPFVITGQRWKTRHRSGVKPKRNANASRSAA